MSDSIKVSVIMPVYNVADYLRDSLSDVLHQTLEEIEVICVDDGSTDESLSILKEMADTDKRIRIITQENQFAGAARNTGLDASKGKYVICWDPDDRFHPEALEKMYRKAEETSADLCICNAQKYDEQKKVYVENKAYLREDLLPDQDPYNKFDIPEQFYSITTNAPWNKMYLREFVNRYQLRYQVIRQANDVYFSLVGQFFAERITWISDIFVDYRFNNSNSLTGKASSTVLCAFDAPKAVYDMLKDQKDFPLIEGSYAANTLRGLLYALDNQTTFDAYQTLYQKLAASGLEELGLTKVEKEKFTNQGQYQEMMEILSIPAEEFLLKKGTIRRLNWDRERSQKNAQIKRNVHLKTECDRLLGRVNELKQEKERLLGRLDEVKQQKAGAIKEKDRLLGRVNELKEEKAGLKSDNKELKKQVSDLQKELDQIKNSKFYKLYKVIAKNTNL